jgi:hypothetical protein
MENISKEFVKSKVDLAGAMPLEEDVVVIKEHNIPPEQFEKYVFFSHVINGVRVTLSKDISVEFEMTHADASLSVGQWGGEGLAKIPRENKAVIEAIMSHPLYTRHKEIRRIPSPDELKYHKAKIAGREFVQKYKEGVEEGIFEPFDFSKMNLEPLQKLANKCGVSVFEIDPVTYLKGAQKTKATLVKELEAAFQFNGE